MTQEKKLSEIANKVTPVEEDQQGKLSGGFAAFASNAADFSGGGASYAAFIFLL